MRATCATCKKSTSYSAKVVTLNNEKYCILPKSIYDGLLDTIAIMSDPEAHRKLQEAFADPEKRRFDSVDDMLKHFGVERD
jgi:PHD/YefM family antitoxin component YafN of YafNO toxin-antitoxin module